MSEKKKKKSEITKTYIYEGAIELFSEKGFEQTTIRDLTQKLGISLGVLYYHFKSKDDVLIHYFRMLHDRTVEGVAPVLESNKSSSTKVRQIIEINLGLLQENQQITRDLINSTSNVSHPLSPFGKELRVYQEGAIHLFRQALAKDHKPGEYLEALSFFYWMYHLGLCLMWANDKSPQYKNTEKLIDLTYPLTRKLVTLTKIGMGKKMFIKITKLMQDILLQ